MPFHLGPLELTIILVVMLMVFGVGQLPKVMKQMGLGMRELRKGIAGEGEEESRRDEHEAEPS